MTPYDKPALVGPVSQKIDRNSKQKVVLFPDLISKNNSISDSFDGSYEDLNPSTCKPKYAYEAGLAGNQNSMAEMNPIDASAGISVDEAIENQFGYDAMFVAR